MDEITYPFWKKLIHVSKRGPRVNKLNIVHTCTQSSSHQLNHDNTPVAQMDLG